MNKLAWGLLNCAECAGAEAGGIRLGAANKEVRLADQAELRALPSKTVTGSNNYVHQSGLRPSRRS